MKAYSVWFVSALMATSLWGQKNTTVSGVLPEPPVPSVQSTSVQPSSAMRGEPTEVAATSLLQAKGFDMESLQLAGKQTSLSGTHFTFTQHVKGAPIFGAHLKLSYLTNGKVRMRHTLVPERILEQEASTPTDPGTGMWVWENDKITWYESDIEDGQGITTEWLTDASGQRVYKLMHGALDQLETATGNVFNPDPITSANAAYGGFYRDWDDQTNNALDAEMVQRSFTVTENGGVYELRNDFVIISEHSAPTVPPATSTNATFNFDRSESGFEDVNTLYHISEYKLYLNGLGLNVVNYAIHADCHGFNDQDQSAFSSFTNPPQLTFGTGGVDDAEDADVIIHEYGHAIMNSTAPGTNFGTQRRALDEAAGDYFAASYSRALEEYEWYKVFNWDGHNEFWPGRWAQSTAHYPEDMQNDLYLDAPIWSATMMQIEMNLGRDETHRLFIESSYGYLSNMTMRDAAQLFVDADSTLNNGQYYAYIAHIFYERGLLETVDVPRPPDLILGISDTAEGQAFVSLINSIGFAAGDAPLRLINESRDPFEVVVLNIAGNEVLSPGTLGAQGTLELFPDRFAPGVYLIHIRGNSRTETYKVIRW